MKYKTRAQPGNRATTKAILFIIPSVVITVVSVILFSQLKGLEETELNVFLITVMAPIVLSLIGMACMQILIYRIIDDSEYFKSGAPIRIVRIGILYSLLFSSIISAGLYHYFTGVLGFSLTDYLYFALLLLMYSAIWLCSSVLWALEKYAHTALIFTISYYMILILTLFAYREDHEYTIIGYSIGIAILLSLLLIISILLFRESKSKLRFSSELSKIFSLGFHSKSAILFSMFYVIALFLDKIIVWVYQGIESGDGLLLTGNYAVGAFLGLIPMGSIAAQVYFTKRTASISDELFKGTLAEIQRKILAYKSIYLSSIKVMLILAMGLFALVAAASTYFISDKEIIKVLVITSIGSIFFSVIVFNSIVLPIFGKGSMSVFAVFFVIIFELCSIPFIEFNIWYASLGFLLGSFAGFLISVTSTMRLFHHFEYNLFRHLLD